ncbi:glucan biosynthesis glucosyltransferase H, partial [Yersinia mollaretii]
LSPIVFSLILSPVVSVLSSRRTLGLASKRAKLFLIPEEYNPPKELLATEAYLKLNHQRALSDGFLHAVMNPAYNALASAMATARHHTRAIIEQVRAERVALALEAGPDKLAKLQRLELLSDPVLISRLHQQVWQQPEQYRVWNRYYRQLAHNQQAFPAVK